MKALTILILAVPLTAQQAPPTTIYLHADILTGARLDTSTPTRVSALAVTNTIITAVGKSDDLLKLKGPHTQVIDLGGLFVMPGFNDAHTHMAYAGRQKLSVDLDGTASLAEMLARIKSATATAQPGQWIQGAGWDHTKWPGAKLPTRQDIDAVTAGHPAIFTRTDGHILVANSAALLAAGISSATEDPEGGKIDRDPTGTPTGIIRETTAIKLISAKIPPASSDLRRKALNLAIADALAHGVTSVQDYSDWEDWLILETMEDRNRLPLRIAEWLDFNLPVAVLKQRRASHSPDDPLLHLTQLKGFMDGSLGSRTAALAEPYADEPDNSGIPRYEQQKLNQMSAERAAAGFQLGFHAIGDEANTFALNAFTAAEQVAVSASTLSSSRSAADGSASAFLLSSRSAAEGSAVASPPSPNPASLRLRIEHAQVLLPTDFDRMATLGVIASMQPSHLLTDMYWAPARLGPERTKYAYAWKSMLTHGIPLAFGTDYPVESINPFRGLYAATTRQSEDGTHTFEPQEKLSIQQAILAYTQTPAYAEFRETTKGRLEPGYLADFIVLDRDPLTATPQELLHTKVLRTIVNNQTVYTAP